MVPRPAQKQRRDSLQDAMRDTWAKQELRLYEGEVADWLHTLFAGTAADGGAAVIGW